MSPDKIAGLRQRIKGGGGLNRATPEKHRQPAQNRDSEQSPDALPSGGLVAHPGVQSHLVRCHGCFQRFGWEASAILGSFAIRYPQHDGKPSAVQRVPWGWV